MHCTMVDRAHKLCEFTQYLSRLNPMRARGATVLSSLRRATARAIDRDRARPHTRAIDMTAVKRANRCATVAFRCARSPMRRPRRARDARRVHARANLECDCPAGRREK